MLTFILSSGRTGTVFIKNAISTLPDITISHERHKHLVRLFNHAKGSPDSKKKFDRLALRIIAANLKSIGNKGENHIEINNMASNYTEEILKIFPKATYIHIVRDPRSYLPSAINWTNSRTLRKLFIMYMPFWVKRPKVYLNNDQPLAKLFSVFAHYWHDSNLNFYKLSKKTANYHLLKFEELKSCPEDFIKKILKLSGYNNEQSSEMITNIIESAKRNQSEKVFPSWHKWNNNSILYLHNVCGNLMKEFGYGQEQDWQAKVNAIL